MSERKHVRKASKYGLRVFCPYRGCSLLQASYGGGSINYVGRGVSGSPGDGHTHGDAFATDVIDVGCDCLGGHTWTVSMAKVRSLMPRKGHATVTLVDVLA